MATTKQTKETSLRARFFYTCFMSLMTAWLGLFGLGLEFTKFNDLIAVSLCCFIMPYLIFLLQFLLNKLFNKEFPMKYIHLNLKWRLLSIIFFSLITILMLYLLRDAGLVILIYLPIYVGFLIFFALWIFIDLIRNYSFKWIFFASFVLLDFLMLMYSWGLLNDL